MLPKHLPGYCWCIQTNGRTSLSPCLHRLCFLHNPLMQDSSCKLQHDVMMLPDTRTKGRLAVVGRQPSPHVSHGLIVRLLKLARPRSLINVTHSCPQREHYCLKQHNTLDTDAVMLSCAASPTSAEIAVDRCQLEHYFVIDMHISW